MIEFVKKSEIFFSHSEDFLTKLFLFLNSRLFLLNLIFLNLLQEKNSVPILRKMADFLKREIVSDSEKEWEAMVSMRRIISIIPKSSENEEKDNAVDLRKD